MDSAALKDSWALVAASGDEVPLFFYSHLFLSHPEIREMFPVSMSGQRDKLVSALGRIVSNADRLDEVTPFIQQLGRDHRRFSVVAEHYPAVGGSLLATLQHFLGPSWTENLAADWAQAYNLIATVMTQAAEQSSGPAWWRAAVTAVERRTLDVAVLQLRPESRLDYAPGQSFAVEIPQRPRLWRYFSPANAPRDDGTVELHVQLVAGGQVSGAMLSSLGVGDRVRIGASVGDQLMLKDDRPAERHDMLMVAGGTGLAPLRAVVEQLDREWQEHSQAPQVHLFHGARMPWNLYEHDFLTRLTQRPWFSYTGVVSEDSSFPGSRGLVGSVAAASREWHGRTALICGSPQMVQHSISALRSAGMSRHDIRAEQFGEVAEPEYSPTTGAG